MWLGKTQYQYIFPAWAGILLHFISCHFITTYRTVEQCIVNVNHMKNVDSTNKQGFTQIKTK